ncbi:MAG: MFS transporter [Patescibacteria group bacterium]
MGYFRNRNINFLNLHSGLVAFSDSIITVFGVIYFITLGFSLPYIFLAWSTTHLFRLMLRPVVLKLVNLIGIKKVLMIGTAAYGGLYLIAAQIVNNHWLFLIFFACFAISDILYWFPYHTYFAQLGEDHNRGKDVGSRESINKILRAISPIVTGFLAQYVGFWLVYLVGAVVTLVAIVPLFYTPDMGRVEEMSFKQAREQVSFTGFRLWFSWAFLYYLHEFIWVIVLFFMVNKFVNFGGLVALEVLFSLVVMLSLGALIDKGRGAKIISWALVSLIIVIIGRTFFVKSIGMIILFQFLMAIAAALYGPLILSIFYNECHRSKNSVWFTFFAEAGWDVGAMICLLLLALWTAGGLDIRYIMPLALVGAIANLWYAKKHLRHKLFEI